MYQADTLGKEFVVLLADVLWYVEGRHERFNKWGKAIPVAFTEFAHFLEKANTEKQKIPTCQLQNYNATATNCSRNLSNPG